MSARIVKCRKGDPCSFSASVKSGIDPRYTKAKFQVRDTWDETKPALLSVDETNGIVITPGTPGIVTVLIGATKTDLIPALDQDREVAALLRLYNGVDDDDRMSFAIPFVLRPDVITDD